MFKKKLPSPFKVLYEDEESLILSQYNHDVDTYCTYKQWWIQVCPGAHPPQTKFSLI